MVQRCFTHIQFENISRNNNRFMNAMANFAFLTPISIEDEQNIIKIESLRHVQKCEKCENHANLK